MICRCARYGGQLNQAVKHGIGVGRIAGDVLVSMGGRQLAIDHGGCAVVSVMDDLQRIALLLSGKKCSTLSSRISTRMRSSLLRAASPGPERTCFPGAGVTCYSLHSRMVASQASDRT
jgi:hypothetical protein